MPSSFAVGNLSRFTAIFSILLSALFSSAQTVTTTKLQPTAQTYLGQSVTFTATVSVAPDDPAPVGQVAFIDSSVSPGIVMGIANLVPSAPGSAVATFTTSILPKALHPITAKFSGEGFNASSDTITHDVGPRTTQSTIPNTPLEATVRSQTTVRITVADSLRDSTSGTFAKSTSIPARVGHASVQLPNGLVAIFGGDDGAGTVYGEVLTYDPGNSSIATRASLHIARTGATATVLLDGKVLVAGGSSNGLVNGLLNSVEIYDPATDTFTDAANLTHARMKHSATLLPDGTVLIAGGMTATGPTSSIEVFDPTANAFTDYSVGLLHERTGHTATLLLDNKTVLFVGGDSAGNKSELLTLATQTQAEIAGPVLPRSTHTATLLIDGTVLITGGGSGTDGAELFNVTNSTFLPIANHAMTTPRTGHTAMLLNSGIVLIIGGLDNENKLVPDSETYTPAFDPAGDARLASMEGVNDTADAVPLVALIPSGEGSSIADLSVTTAHFSSGKRDLRGRYLGDVNHSASESSITVLTVHKVELTVTAKDDSKTYDGTTSSSLVPTLTAGEILSGDHHIATQVFDSRNVALPSPAPQRKLVPQLDIRDAAEADVREDYNVTPIEANGTILKLPLTVTAVADEKVYDGGLASSSNSVVPTFTPALATADSAAFIQAFKTKDVAVDKTIEPSGNVSDGNSGENYSYDFKTNSAGVITPKPITATVAVEDKVYDQSTNAKVVSCVPNDTVNSPPGTLSCTVTAANFVDKNAGENKNVTASGIVLEGSEAVNYNLATSATTKAKISPSPLNVTAKGIDKTYDATTNATAKLTDNRFENDDLTLVYAAKFADKNANPSGPPKDVEVTGISISAGTDKGNYTVANSTWATTANILLAPLTITFKADGKTYDGTTTAVVTPSDNRINDQEKMTVTSTAAFTSRNAADSATVDITKIAIEGGDSGNYSLSETTATTTAKISKRPVTITAGTATKTYDGNDTASNELLLVTGEGLVGGDKAEFIEKFESSSAGVNKVLIPSGVAIDGNNGLNYAYTYISNSTGVINRKPLTFTLQAADKIYDSELTASVTCTPTKSEIVGEDDVTCLVGSALFKDKNAATNKTIDVDKIVTGGLAGANYVVNATGAVTASIKQRTLAITNFTAQSKTYDGTDRVLTFSFGDDHITKDTISTSATPPTFSDKNAGSEKTVTLTGFALNPAATDDSPNYVVRNPSATTTANIAQATLIVIAHPNDKIFDASLLATLSSTPFDDNRVRKGAIVLSDDILAVSFSTATFDAINAGSRIVTVGGIALSGPDAANYVTQPTILAPATILPAKTKSRVSIANTTTSAGAEYTISVAVAPEIAGVPAGSVTFLDRLTAADGSKTTNSLGTAILQGGAGSITVSKLPVGSHHISISYAPDPDFVGGDTNTAAAITTTAPLVVSAGQASPLLTASILNPTPADITGLHCIVESAGGLPVANTSCSVDQTTIASGAVANVKVTVTTIKQSASLLRPGGVLFAAFAMLCPAFLIMPVAFSNMTRRERTKRRLHLLASFFGVALLVLLIIASSSCGGSGFSNPQNQLQPSGTSNSTLPGTYVVMLYGSTDQNPKAPLASIPLQVTY